MKNVITLGKLIDLSILFCSPSSLTRNELARPVMGTIFLVYILAFVLCTVWLVVFRIIVRMDKQNYNVDMDASLPICTCACGVNICDRLWEKGHIRAYFQNRVIGTAG